MDALFIKDFATEKITPSFVDTVKAVGMGGVAVTATALAAPAGTIIGGTIGGLALPILVGGYSMKAVVPEIKKKSEPIGKLTEIGVELAGGFKPGVMAEKAVQTAASAFRLSLKRALAGGIASGAATGTMREIGGESEGWVKEVAGGGLSAVAVTLPVHGLRGSFHLASNVLGKTKTYSKFKDLAGKLVDKVFFDDVPKEVRRRLGGFASLEAVGEAVLNNQSERIAKFIASEEFTKHYVDYLKKFFTDEEADFILNYESKFHPHKRTSVAAALELMPRELLEKFYNEVYKPLGRYGDEAYNAFRKNWYAIAARDLISEFRKIHAQYKDEYLNALKDYNDIVSPHKNAITRLQGVRAILELPEDVKKVSDLRRLGEDADPRVIEEINKLYLRALAATGRASDAKYVVRNLLANRELDAYSVFVLSQNLERQKFFLAAVKSAMKYISEKARSDDEVRELLRTKFAKIFAPRVKPKEVATEAEKAFRKDVGIPFESDIIVSFFKMGDRVLKNKLISSKELKALEEAFNFKKTTIRKGFRRSLAFIDKLKRVGIEPAVTIRETEDNIARGLLAYIRKKPSLDHPLFVQFLTYMPRENFYPLRFRTEDVAEISQVINQYVGANAASWRNALKRRKVATLTEHIKHALRSNTPEALYPEFKQSSDLVKAWVMGRQLPQAIEEYRKFVNKAIDEGIWGVYTEPKIQKLGLLKTERWNWEKIPPIWGVTMQTIYMHRGLKQMLDNLMSYARLRPDIPWTRQGSNALVWVNSMIKHMVLKFSLFHAVTLTKSALSANVPMDVTTTALRNALWSVFQGKSVYDVASAYDEVIDFLMFAKRADLAPFLSVGMSDADRKLRNKFLQSFYDKLTSSPYIAKYSDKVWKVFNLDEHLTWDLLYRDYKILIAKHYVDMFKRGELSLEEAVRNIEEINNIFGGAKDWFFISPRKQMMLRLLMFAPDWYLSLWRNFSRWAANDATSLVVDFYPAMLRLHLYIANIIHSAVNRQSVFEKVSDDPIEALKNWRDLFRITIPLVDKTGRRKLLTLDIASVELEPLEMFFGSAFLLENLGKVITRKDMTVLEKLMFLFGGMSKEFGKYLVTKMSSLARLTGELTSNRDLPISERLIAGIKSIVPIGLIGAVGLRYRNYATLPNDRWFMDFAQFMEALSFKARIMDDFESYVVQNMHNKFVQKDIDRFFDEYMRLATDLKRMDLIPAKSRSNFYESVGAGIVRKLMKELYIIDQIDAAIKYRDIEALEEIRRTAIPRIIQSIRQSELSPRIKAVALREASRIFNVVLRERMRQGRVRAYKEG
jgi:hypothetical protein